MSWAAWKDAELKKGEDQGHQAPKAEWAPEDYMRSCDTPACNKQYMAEPHWEDGYIHKHCCSSCTRTGGYQHTRRCRRHNGPGFNYKGTRSSGSWSPAPAWQDQGWKYHERTWTEPQNWAEWDEGA
eukprot:11724818-Heterocapsa_arctica.AAC.1